MIILSLHRSLDIVWSEKWMDLLGSIYGPPLGRRRVGSFMQISYSTEPLQQDSRLWTRLYKPLLQWIQAGDHIISLTYENASYPGVGRLYISLTSRRLK